MLKSHQNPLHDLVIARHDETGVVAAFIRRLEQFGELSKQEKQSIENSTFSVRQIGGDQDIVRVGDAPVYCPLLLDGFACRYKMLENGQR